MVPARPSKNTSRLPTCQHADSSTAAGTRAGGSSVFIVCTSATATPIHSPIRVASIARPRRRRGRCGSRSHRFPRCPEPDSQAASIFRKNGQCLPPPAKNHPPQPAVSRKRAKLHCAAVSSEKNARPVSPARRQSSKHLLATGEDSQQQVHRQRGDDEQQRKRRRHQVIMWL